MSSQHIELIDFQYLLIGIEAKKTNKKMSSASVASNEMSMNAASMMNMGFQPIPGMLSPTPMMGGMMSPPPMLMPTPIQGGMAMAPGQGTYIECFHTMVWLVLFNISLFKCLFGTR